MNGQPENLTRLIGSALRKLEGGDQLQKASRAMRLWPDIVGKVIAAKAKVLHVNRRTLVIAVPSSAWSNQLNLLKSRYLEAIAEHVGAGVITDLRWRVMDPADRDQPSGLSGQPSRTRISEGPTEPWEKLDLAQQQAFERQTQVIADSQLADVARRVLAAQEVRKQRLVAQGWVPCQRCQVLHEPASDGPFCPPCGLRTS